MQRYTVMKKWIALVLCFATLLASVALLSGCGSKEKTPDTIKKAGELVIATSPDFPPFESLDGNGNVVGIEIDILNIVRDLKDLPNGLRFGASRRTGKQI